MDCIRAAADLQELLVAHSNAERQVSMLGRFYNISLFDTPKSLLSRRGNKHYINNGMFDV